MKLTIRIALVLTVLGCSPTDGSKMPKKWGPATNETRIAIFLKGSDTAIKADQPVTLLICVRNLSTNETIWLLRAIPPERDPTRGHLGHVVVWPPLITSDQF